MKLILKKKLNSSANESKAPFVIRLITRGKVLEMSPLRGRVASAEGMILEKVGSDLADIEIGSAKSERCDCTERYNLVSINQL